MGLAMKLTIMIPPNCPPTILADVNNAAQFVLLSLHDTQAAVQINGTPSGVRVFVNSEVFAERLKGLTLTGTKEPLPDTYATYAIFRSHMPLHKPASISVQPQL